MTVDVRETASSCGRDISAHFMTFQQIVARAEDLLNTGRFEEAVLCGQMAADYAWHNHPGVFASLRLERILLAIGRDVCRASPSSRPTRTAAPGSPARVLHVLTQAYAIGGHTRLVWRWIQRDAGRVHSVVLTGQGRYDVPPQLREAVDRSGGELRILDAEAGSLLVQAQALRDLALCGDCVVLHVHPYDAVPLVALASRDSLPAVIFLNHADHVFWLGVCVSDVVASLRESGLHLARDRRGVEDHRCVLLPVPLTPAERTLSRREAKRRLAVSEDSVMILSVASAYKYAPTIGTSFPEALAPVLEQHARSVAVAVGPEPEGPWDSVRARSHGRLIAAGVRDDVASFYQAADIYVDSFPFSSLTSLLEAASYGVPVASYCSHAEEAAVLCADDPGLSAGLIRVTGVSELRDAVSQLIEDAELRARTGTRAQDDVLRVHAGEQWDAALENVYLRADACAGPCVAPGTPGQGPSPRECGNRAPTILDAELVRLRTDAGTPRDFNAWVETQAAEVLTLRDTAHLSLTRRRAITMLRAFPWLARAPWVRSSVAAMVRRLALAHDAPLTAVREMCADLGVAGRADSAVDRAWVRRLLAEVWAELAMAFGSGAPRNDRAAASAALRAVFYGRSHVGRRTLLRVVARWITGVRSARVAARKIALSLRLLAMGLRLGVRSPGGVMWLSRKAWAALRRGGLREVRTRLLAYASRYAQAQTYDTWVGLYDVLTDDDRREIRARVETLSHRPLISIIMPVYNTPERWLRGAIESVVRQLYPHWELCIADDASRLPHVRKILDDYQAKDARIKVTFRKRNGHIAEASNSAIALATGEYLALLDHDDVLAEHALYMVAEELTRCPDAGLIYSDEDKIDARGHRYDPYFKPDWSPDLFSSQNFVNHLGVYRTSLVRRLGGFRAGYEGSQDYDLALRIVAAIPESRIRHIPFVLYHWRAVRDSVAGRPDAKAYACEAARRALRAHFERCGIPVEVTGALGQFHRVTRRLPDPPPLVTVIIPTRDRVALLRKCIDGVLEKTAYKNLEVLVVDNDSRDAGTLAYLEDLARRPGVRVARRQGAFNFSALNNLGARMADGEVLCLANNDLEVISPDWLREMVSQAMRPDVGAVGAMLYYPGDVIQHAGVVLGLGGVAGHAHKWQIRGTPGYFGRAGLIQNFSAVTAACTVLRRAVFDEVGGFDEDHLAVAFNDVDLCLRIRERGYLIVWTPYAELYHTESASRGPDDIPAQRVRFAREFECMQQRWGAVLPNDPYYNPNLSLEREDFALAFPPRTRRPWLAQDEEQHRARVHAAHP